MTLEEMLERANTCAFHPMNQRDRIVIEEIWLATIEICKRLGDTLTPDPEEVRKLRVRTGASMFDCKKALEDTTCNFNAAARLLEERHQMP